jgi:hypothetical protein
MRIHTDQPRSALYECLPRGVDLDGASVHGSRKRPHAFEVSLVVWDGGKGTSHPRRRNFSSSIGKEGYAATYDEWGYWLAALYELDPMMIAGPYKSRSDFHAQTQCAYDTTSATV